MQNKMTWQPIESAPKGGGADRVDDPAWVEPPNILLRFENEEQSVCYWEWSCAEGGRDYRVGVEAWVEPVSGEIVSPHYGDATHWMPLPDPPEG